LVISPIVTKVTHVIRLANNVDMGDVSRSRKLSEATSVSRTT